MTYITDPFIPRKTQRTWPTCLADSSSPDCHCVAQGGGLLFIGSIFNSSAIFLIDGCWDALLIQLWLPHESNLLYFQPPEPHKQRRQTHSNRECKSDLICHTGTHSSRFMRHRKSDFSLWSTWCYSSSGGEELSVNDEASSNNTRLQTFMQLRNWWCCSYLCVYFMQECVFVLHLHFHNIRDGLYS